MHNTNAEHNTTKHRVPHNTIRTDKTCSYIHSHRGGDTKARCVGPTSYLLRAFDQRLKYNVERVVVAHVVRARVRARHVGVEVPRPPRRPPRSPCRPRWTLHYVVVASMSLYVPQVQRDPLCSPILQTAIAVRRFSLYDFVSNDKIFVCNT